MVKSPVSAVAVTHTHAHTSNLIENKMSFVKALFVLYENER